MNDEIKAMCKKCGVFCLIEEIKYFSPHLCLKCHDQQCKPKKRTYLNRVKKEKSDE